MKKGFSLIELLISLIIISIITAAFAPVISKRIISRSASILVAKDCKTIDHCESYDSSCNCTGCAEGYEINGGICVKKKNYTEAECYVAGNICIAKFNAGDTYIGGLEIPDNLVTKYIPNTSASGTAESNVCIIGNGTGTISAQCDSANGGYSGCTRTLCTWEVANKICKYHGWRLPTTTELKNFASYSIGKGEQGLQLCDNASGKSSAYCARNAYCPHVYNSWCQPFALWSAEMYNTSRRDNRYLQSGNFLGPLDWYSDNSAYSVRCVRDL